MSQSPALMEAAAGNHQLEVLQEGFRMEEVGKLMSLEINTRGHWNAGGVTKSGRGCGPVFRTSEDPDLRSDADKVVFFFCSSSR